MTPQMEEQLMQYLDGELDGPAAREVERLLAQSAEARALLSDFEEVGSSVRAIGLDRARALGDVTEAVMARVSEDMGPASGAPMASRVIPMARYWAPAAALAMAAAAAGALYFRPVRAPVPAPARVLPTLAVAPTIASSVVAADESTPGEEEPGAEIESVDFGAHNGTIFMVATGPQVTPVVWLMDENAPGGVRMKPL